MQFYTGKKLQAKFMRRHSRWTPDNRVLHLLFRFLSIVVCSYSFDRRQERSTRVTNNARPRSEGIRASSLRHACPVESKICGSSSFPPSLSAAISVNWRNDGRQKSSRFQLFHGNYLSSHSVSHGMRIWPTASVPLFLG